MDVPLVIEIFEKITNQTTQFYCMATLQILRCCNNTLSLQKSDKFIVVKQQISFVTIFKMSGQTGRFRQKFLIC